MASNRESLSSYDLPSFFIDSVFVLFAAESGLESAEELVRLFRGHLKVGGGHLLGIVVRLALVKAREV